MPLVATRIEAAGVLGISDKTLGRYKKEPDFPDCKAGYDIEVIRAWIEEHERKGSAAGGRYSQVRMEIAQETLREKQGKNLLRALEIAEKQRKLLPRDMVHDLLMECAAMIRSVSSQLQKSGNVAAQKLIDEQMDRFKKVVNDRLARAAKSASERV